MKPSCKCFKSEIVFFFLFRKGSNLELKLVFIVMLLNPRLLTCVDFSSLCEQKGEAIKFIPTFGILNSAVFCPLEAGYLIKACMHGWGRQGERKASLNPYFAVGGGERGTFSGLIAISLIFSSFFPSHARFFSSPGSSTKQ